MTTINKGRQKKFLLILPLLVIPFMTLFFWALGGGKNAQANPAAQLQGLNMQLPGAKLKNDSTENKLSFYTQAEKDSLKIRQAQKDDPYYRDSTRQDTTGKLQTGVIGSADQFVSKGYNTYGTGNNAHQSLVSNEQAINQRLAALNKQISQQPVSNTATSAGNPNNTDSQADKLSAMMAKLNNSGSAEDPEMKQLSGMLDKIIDIEHPDLAKQKIKEQSEKQRGMALPVRENGGDKDATLLNSDGLPVSQGFQQNGFYDLDRSTGVIADNAITAVVHETQTLTAGATIKMRLLQDIYINGRLIPRDNFVFGTCSIDADRLTIDIKTIRLGSSVFPVSMKVLDQDGITGIYVPGAISRDAAKDGADQAIQSLDLYSMSPSFGAQAAGAGVQAVKGLFSKKVKLIKVTVKAGYSVLLVNANQLN